MSQYGIHLGGHIQLLQVDTSSIIFGIRSSNIIINLNSTSVELSKTLDIINL
jgi:ribosomal protein S2